MSPNLSLVCVLSALAGTSCQGTNSTTLSTSCTCTVDTTSVAELAARPRPELIADKQRVLAATKRADVCLVNALSPEEFSGESPIHYGRRGRIPSSVNVPAAQLIDPRSYAVGSIKATFEKYSHLEDLLPAMGYGETQRKELAETINATPCDLVLASCHLPSAFVSCVAAEVMIGKGLTRQGQAQIGAMVRNGNRTEPQPKQPKDWEIHMRDPGKVW